MTFSLMTLSMITHGMRAFSNLQLKTLNIMTISIKTLNRMTVSILALTTMVHSIMTLKKMTLNIMTLCTTLSIMHYSNKILRILQCTSYDEHNMLSVITLNAALLLT
jgi:hypothetical protein